MLFLGAEGRPQVFILWNEELIDLNLDLDLNLMDRKVSWDDARFTNVNQAFHFILILARQIYKCQFGVQVLS